MERLTVRIAGTAAMAFEHEEMHTLPEWLDIVHARLADYEDTGLTPEEITAMTGNLRQINEDKEREARRVAAMVDKATHAIGLNNKKAYYRHGRYWYKPYRNYYCAGPAGDLVWERMVQQGYAEASRRLDSTYYHMTPAGLNWLGQQTNIKIHDPED